MPTKNTNVRFFFHTANPGELTYACPFVIREDMIIPTMLYLGYGVQVTINKDYEIKINRLSDEQILENFLNDLEDPSILEEITEERYNTLYPYLGKIIAIKEIEL